MGRSSRGIGQKGKVFPLTRRCCPSSRPNVARTGVSWATVMGQRPGLLRIRTEGLDRVVDGSRPLNIGRDPASDVVVDNPRVSRRHAVLRFRAPEGWVLEDAGSTGGTYHLGQRVAAISVAADTVAWLGHPVTGSWIEMAPLAPLGAAAGPRLTGRGDHSFRVTDGSWRSTSIAAG